MKGWPTAAPSTPYLHTHTQSSSRLFEEILVASVSYPAMQLKERADQFRIYTWDALCDSYLYDVGSILSHHMHAQNTICLGVHNELQQITQGATNDRGKESQSERHSTRAWVIPQRQGVTFRKAIKMCTDKQQRQGVTFREANKMCMGYSLTGLRQGREFRQRM